MLASALVLTAAVPAWAAPLSSKRAQAVAVKAQVDALDQRAEIVTQDYDAAASAYHSLNVQVAKIESRLASITAQTGTLQTSLDSRVDVMYRTGPLGILDVLLGARSFNDFATAWDLLNAQNKQEASTVATLKVLQGEAVSERAALTTAQASAQATYDTMSQRRSSILGMLAQRKALLNGIQSEINALEAQQNAERAAAARTYGGGGGGTGWNWGIRPTPRGRASSTSRSSTWDAPISGGRPARTRSTAPGSPCSSTRR